ncbi:MAG TPA: NAD(P)H-dependent oxidoreductase subunit E [Aggregatilineales bacterium]|nr:NAD(P)H-dependent oxidoreductase subunit E [Anaerolineales bacterium]HRE48230.1 NAD(P)H-dependent oxidoreductase subunit E [Aggregatilineales bacterium]
MDPKIPIPNPDDKRWRLVVAKMRHHGFAPEALIETLHAVQSAFGYLDTTALRFVAASLRIPLSRVYGVATFYNVFIMKPQGEHTCVVCLGTACYIKGSAEVLAEIQRTNHLAPGETTPDKKVSLVIARCLGTCGIAPVATFDGDVIGKISPQQAVSKIEEWLTP